VPLPSIVTEALAGHMAQVFTNEHRATAAERESAGQRL